MDLIFEQTVTVQDREVNQNGTLKLSSLLRYMQQVSGGHSDRLGFSWDALRENGLFWAVSRHRVVIHRLPKAGETVRLQTWPMPATRAAYPRAVQAVDSKGELLFQAVSLWVLMNTHTRTMVLPGKSGVEVPGTVRGTEIKAPGSLPPVTGNQSVLWQVGQEDLDINGHVNNARYLEQAEKLLENSKLTVQELTVCYLSEALLGQEIFLHWDLAENGVLLADGVRRRTDVRGETERVFAVKLGCSVNQQEL